MSEITSTPPAPESAPAAAAAPAPAPPRRRVFGRYPGLVALGLFALAAVILWQTGTLDSLLGITRPEGLTEEETKAPPMPVGVNINKASAEELCQVLGVKEKVAEDIIARRPFKDMEAVLKVKGIGDKKLAKLRPLIRLH